MFTPDSQMRIHRFPPAPASLPFPPPCSPAKSPHEWGYLTLSASVNLYVAKLEQLSDFH